MKALSGLVAITCKNMGGCQKTVVQRLDFDLEGGCIIPPMMKCGTGDASCMDCTAGGAGPGGGPPGVGGPGSPATGPKAILRYAGGVRATRGCQGHRPGT